MRHRTCDDDGLQPERVADERKAVALAVKRARHLALLPYPPNMA